MASLEKLLALKEVDIVCFPHSGWLTDYIPAFERAKKQMELWLEILSQLPPEAGREEAVAELLRPRPCDGKAEKTARERQKKRTVLHRTVGERLSRLDKKGRGGAVNCEGTGAFGKR